MSPASGSMSLVQWGFFAGDEDGEFERQIEAANFKTPFVVAASSLAQSR